MGDFGKNGRPTQIVYEDQMEGWNPFKAISSAFDAVKDAAEKAYKAAVSPIQSALGKDVTKVFQAPVKAATFSFDALKKPIESAVKSVAQGTTALVSGKKPSGGVEEVTQEVIQYVDENGNPISAEDLAAYNLASSGQATPNYEVPLADNTSSNTGKYVAYGVGTAVVAGLAYYYLTKGKK